MLRLWRLHAQVLGDDEYHVIDAALHLKFPEILWTFLPSDFCLPLGAFLRLWHGLDLPLAEWVCRLPSLLAGVLILGILPSFVERRLGRPVAMLFAWLLALSPPLVRQSRRPA